MANPTWPVTIPGPTSDSVSYEPLFDNIIKSQMEVGQKTRRRATFCPDKAAFKLVLNKAQYQALDAFYKTTLKEVLPFDWKDFRDNSPRTYAFQSAPKYSLAAPGANLWYATLDLVTLP